MESGNPAHENLSRLNDKEDDLVLNLEKHFSLILMQYLVNIVLISDMD